jgi:hypothetical protein
MLDLTIRTSLRRQPGLIELEIIQIERHIAARPIFVGSHCSFKRRGFGNGTSEVCARTKIFNVGQVIVRSQLG